MRMRKFEFSSPSCLADGLKLLAQKGFEGKVIAGGTDLVVQMKDKSVVPKQVISLLKIPELAGIKKRGKGLRIGALVKHAALENAPALKDGWEILAVAAHKIGSPQVRNVATVGGNLCNASPAADLALPLLVLETEVVLCSKRRERQVPLDSFFAGPGKTVMARDEILKEVLIAPVPAGSIWAFLKLGRRKSMDLSIASVAVLLTLEPRRKICLRARLALGAVFPTPLRAKETEKFLEGKVLDEEVIRAAGERAQKECRPISDIRASAEYRKQIVRVLVERAIKKSLGISTPPTGI